MEQKSISRLLNDQFNKIIWRKKIMDPVTLGVVALMGAVATIGGAAEDLESTRRLLVNQSLMVFGVVSLVLLQD